MTTGTTRDYGCAKHLVALIASCNDHPSISAWHALTKVCGQMCGQLRLELDVTLPQYDVLNQLGGIQEGLTFVQLSKNLGVSPPNLTGIVDRLERLELVTRQPNPRDRRSITVRLTQKGQTYVEESQRNHQRDLVEALRVLRKKDLTELRRILERLGGALEVRSERRAVGPRNDRTT